jgi:hypothetical protein
MFFHKNHYCQSSQIYIKKITQRIESFNKSQESFFGDMMLDYEIYCKKIFENTLNVDSNWTVSDLNSDFEFNIQPDDSVILSSCLLDFQYLVIKLFIDKIQTSDISSIQTFLFWSPKIKEKEKLKMEVFVLLFKTENSKFLTPSLINSLKSFFNLITLKPGYLNYFFSFLFLFLSQKTENNFNSVMFEIIESTLNEFLPNLFLTDNTDYQTLFSITYIFYRFSISQIENHRQIQPVDHFLQNLAIWYKKNTWTAFYQISKNIASNEFVSFYFTIPTLKHSKTNYIKMKFIKDIYHYLIFMGFYLLRMPFSLIIDIMIEVNQQNNDINVNFICEISRELETHIILQHQKKKICPKSVKNLITKESIILDCLKLVWPFLKTKAEIFKICFLNHRFYRKLKTKISKSLLLEPEIDQKKRLKYWNSIIDCDEKFIKFYKKQIINNHKITNGFSKSCQTFNQIHLDVIRTGFVHPSSRNALENILYKISNEFPLMSYYQGMNYLCGFLLIYTRYNENMTEKIYNYLVFKNFDECFRNNFQDLKKMTFICENLIQKYNYKFDKVISDHQISSDFYLSSFLLTMFTNTLAQIECFDVLAKIFDIFFSLKWVGIYRFIIYFVETLNQSLLKLDSDKVLLFFNKDIFEKLAEIDFREMTMSIKSSSISKQEIDDLSFKYESSRKIVDKYWSDFYENRKQKLMIEFSNKSK